MILITEDGHENIIKYCNRGIDGRVFADAREMDAVMIARWNEVVGPDDTVYHLGDFALCPDWRKREILYSLNGRKILIVGNHDMWPKGRYRVDRTSEWNVELACKDYLALGFDEVYPEGAIEIADYKLVHHPRKEKGRYFCGHVHDLWSSQDERPWGALNVNVGVDIHDFRPVTIQQALAVLKKKAAR